MGLSFLRNVVDGLGLSPRDVNYAIETFAEHDVHRLLEEQADTSDAEKMRARARTERETLAKLIEEDAIEQARLAESSKETEVKV